MTCITYVHPISYRSDEQESKRFFIKSSKFALFRLAFTLGITSRQQNAEGRFANVKRDRPDFLVTRWIERDLAILRAKQSCLSACLGSVIQNVVKHPEKTNQS